MDLSNLRVGQGFDLHRYGSDLSKNLILAGVEFDFPALVGHSDGDVLTHSVIDSLLSPTGLGDIGTLFSDEDSQWENYSSLAMLTTVNELLEKNGWNVINVDVTLVTEKPHIAEFKDVMQDNLGRIIKAPVSIKGKRTEGSVQFEDVMTCYSVSLLSYHD